MKYVGHAIQIRQQFTMLTKCQALYYAHNPPCCDGGKSPPPHYDPFPLPPWKPEPYDLGVDGPIRFDNPKTLAPLLLIPFFIFAR